MAYATYLFSGIGAVVLIETVLTISNILTSYILPDGKTLEEYVTEQTGLGVSA